MKPLQGGVSENRLQWSGGHHGRQGHANQNQINFEASCSFGCHFEMSAPSDDIEYSSV